MNGFLALTVFSSSCHGALGFIHTKKILINSNLNLPSVSHRFYGVSGSISCTPSQFGHERILSIRKSARVRSIHDSSAPQSVCRSSMLFSKVEYCMEEEMAAMVNKDIMSVVDLQENEPKIADDTIASNNLYDADANKNSIQSPATQHFDPTFTPILILCFLVTLLSALDRVAMSIAILPISKEYALSETIKGNVASAVSYGYGLAIVPIGLAVSVASSRALMMGGVALWSVATLGTPIMVELSNAGAEALLFPLLAIRGIMGAAEATVLPTMQRIMANWVPPEKKASVLGTILAGFQVGTLSAYIVSPLVMDAMQGIDGSPEGVDGWRGLFYIYGMAGLLWMVPWWLYAKDAPESTAPLSRKGEECQETFVNSMREDDASLVFEECAIDSDGSLSANPNLQRDNRLDGVQSLLQSAPWQGFLTSKGVWAMTLAHAAKNWELYNLLAWTPTFFSEQYGLNTKESALLSVVPSICGICGGLTTGNVADYVLVKLEQDATDNKSMDEKRTQVRKVIQSIALLGPAVCLYSLSNIPEQATTAQFLLGGAVGLQAFDVAGFGAATQDKAGTRWSGLLYSLTSLPGVMVGSLSVSVTGKILDAMAEDRGWSTVFQLNSVICVAGALCFLALYDSKKEFE